MVNIEFFKEKIHLNLNSLKKKLSFFKKGYINASFFKEEFAFLKKEAITTISKENKTVIITKNKNDLIKIKNLIKKKFNLECKILIKELNLEIEDLKFRDGIKKITFIINNIFNKHKISLRNLKMKFKKEIKFESKEEKIKKLKFIEKEINDSLKEMKEIEIKTIHNLN